MGQIVIETSGPAWEKLGEAIGHLPKKFIATELKLVLGRIATVAAGDLRQRIPTVTKKLKKSIGTKKDKYKSGNAYAIVGFRSGMGVRRYAASAVYGTDWRTTVKGADRGFNREMVPDPFRATSAAIKERARAEVYATIDSALEKGTKRYPNLKKTY